ncbi:MAG: hypothetical protein JWM58_3057 [Rhizobium sp.]|nr:hypothetical protein [Rhizobium sp.]
MCEKGGDRSSPVSFSGIGTWIVPESVHDHGARERPAPQSAGRIADAFHRRCKAFQLQPPFPHCHQCALHGLTPGRCRQISMPAIPPVSSCNRRRTPTFPQKRIGTRRRWTASSETCSERSSGRSVFRLTHISAKMGVLPQCKMAMGKTAESACIHAKAGY